MKIPDKGKTDSYKISDTKDAIVKQSDTGQFWVTLNEHLLPGEKIRYDIGSIFDNDSNIMFLNTVEELKEHLLEIADEEYKDQFRE